MAESPTLHSRLRVLVAKTYRAEKLFSSIRNSSDPKILSLASLSDLANDIRAKEWQSAHHDLRQRLNDLLSPQVSPGGLTPGAQELYSHFRQAYEADRADLNRGIAAIQETAEREEFTQSLRFSLDLIRIKARLQVHKAIADELSGALQLTGRALTDFGSRVDNAPQESSEEQGRNKVIPLRPRATATGR